MFKVFGISWLWFHLQVCSTQSRGYGIIPMSVLGGPESELYRWCSKMLFSEKQKSTITIHVNHLLSLNCQDIFSEKKTTAK